MKHRLLALDFDGVIYDSVAAKVAGFAAAGRQIDGRLAHFMADSLLENFGRPRQWFVDQALVYAGVELGLKVDPEQLLDLIGEHVASALKDTEIVLGARQILTGASPFGEAVYIVSGSPLEDAYRLLERDGIAFPVERSYFSVPSKAERLSLICESAQIAPKELLFIGDSPVDYQAALGAGCDFIRRRSQLKFGELNRGDFVTIQNLEELI